MISYVTFNDCKGDDFYYIKIKVHIMQWGTNILLSLNVHDRKMMIKKIYNGVTVSCGYWQIIIIIIIIIISIFGLFRYIPLQPFMM